MARRKLFVTPNPPTGKFNKNYSGKIEVNAGPAMSGRLAGRAGEIVRFVEQKNPGLKQVIIDKAGNIVGYAAASAGSAIAKNLSDRLDNYFTPTSKYNPNSSGGAPNPKYSDKVFPGSRNSDDVNSSYALSKAPNPKAVHLNSGILPNTFVNDYMSPVEGACSPLHMSVAQIQIPTTTGNPIKDYFTNTVCFDLQSRVQENVGFSVDITTTLSTANIVAAFNSALSALCCYFYYSSILSYESDSRNKNAGMVALRQTIDASILSDLSQLGKRLEDTPVPPRLVELCRYIFGTYYSANSQGSPLIKMCPNNALFYGAAPSPTYPAACMASLNSYTATFALIRKAMKSWRIGHLYDVPPTPRFDKNFSTIFANVGSSNKGTTGVAANVYTNTVADANTAAPYVSYANNLDGLAFALSNVYVTAGAIQPYILQYPVATTTYPDTRYSYYKVGSTLGFYPAAQYPFLALSRQESAMFVSGTAYTPHLSGTDKCQNVTGAALNQSAQSSLDFLFESKKLRISK